MAVVPIRFDPERALELVLYVANQLRYPTLHSVSKVVYFADREHLSRYGSLLSGDNYVAMRHGPVPSAIYNLLKAAAGRQEPLIPAEFYELVGQSEGGGREPRAALAASQSRASQRLAARMSRRLHQDQWPAQFQASD